jgi:hypothetical protein
MKNENENRGIVLNGGPSKSRKEAFTSYLKGDLKSLPQFKGKKR